MPSTIHKKARTQGGLVPPPLKVAKPSVDSGSKAASPSEERLPALPDPEIPWNQYSQALKVILEHNAKVQPDPMANMKAQETKKTNEGSKAAAFACEFRIPKSTVDKGGESSTQDSSKDNKPSNSAKPTDQPSTATRMGYQEGIECLNDTINCLKALELQGPGEHEPLAPLKAPPAGTTADTLDTVTKIVKASTSHSSSTGHVKWKTTATIALAPAPTKKPFHERPLSPQNQPQGKDQSSWTSSAAKTVLPKSVSSWLYIGPSSSSKEPIQTETKDDNLTFMTESEYHAAKAAAAAKAIKDSETTKSGSAAVNPSEQWKKIEKEIDPM